MKTTFHFLAFLVLFLAASANGQVTQAWVQKYNGPANLADVALATAMDASGNVAVTGYSMNANGNADYYTAKYAAADGALVWEKRYNGTGNGNDYGHGVAMDTAGNVLVTGASERSSGNSALYQRGAVSIGAATQVAGLKRFEFEAALTERQIERNYGADDLASDVAWANSVS